jgi:hypothetical protein
MSECEAVRDKSDLSVVIDHLRDELLRLSKQREEAGERIGVLRKTITGLMTVFGDRVVDNQLLSMLGHSESQRHSGLTKECRLALSGSGTGLTVRELCDRVKQSGALENHRNPMASIGVVLNRLVGYGEVKAIFDGGARRYQWIA